MATIILVPPNHCGKPMAINARINRVSGPRIQYKCSHCGKLKTVKVEG